MNNNVMTVMFANDIVILAIHENPIDTSKLLQNDLNKIEKCAKNWKLS